MKNCVEIIKGSPIEEFVERPIIFLFSQSEKMKNLSSLLPSFGMAVIYYDQNQMVSSISFDDRVDIKKLIDTLKTKFNSLALVEIFEGEEASSSQGRRFLLRLGKDLGKEVASKLMQIYSSARDDSGFSVDLTDAGKGTLGQSLAKPDQGVYYLRLELTEYGSVNLEKSEGDLSEIAFLIAGILPND